MLKLLKRLRGLSPSPTPSARLFPPPPPYHKPSSDDAEAKLFSEMDMASVLGVSAGAVRRLDAGGKLPEPIRLGNFIRWRRLEIEDWIAAGCPDRGHWNWFPDECFHSPC